MEHKNNISSLLGPGNVEVIAKKLGLSICDAIAALRRARPGHSVVRETLRIAEASSALAAAKKSASLATAA